MGITDSKMLAEKVLTACKEAQKQGKSKLDADSLLSDKVVLQAAKRVLRHIPKNTRGTNYQNAAERAAARPVSSIAIPKVVKDIQANQTAALEQRSPQENTYKSILQDGYLQPQSTKYCSLAECYMLMDKIKKENDLGPIRLRFYYLMFYRLKERIQPKGIWKDAISFMVDIICLSGLVKETKEEIRRKLTSWSARGQRYDLLAKDLGGLGSLFVLPQDIPESVWLRDLPKSKDNVRRIAVLKNVKERGIVPIAESLNITAQVELDNLWAQIEASIDLEVERQLSVHNPRLSYHQGQGHRGPQEQNAILPHLNELSLQSPYRTADYLPASQSVTNGNTQLNRPIAASNPSVTTSSPNISELSHDTTSRMSESSVSVPIDGNNNLVPLSRRQNVADEGSFSYNGNNHHDLASFSLIPDPHAADIFTPFPGNDHHDLASFSMHQSAANVDSLSPFNVNNHHDLASFSLPVHHTAADIFPSVPGDHDLASFSIIPHPAFANDNATSYTHLELDTLPPHDVSRDTMLASNTNFAAVSMSTTVTSASESASASRFTSSPPGLNNFTVK